MGRILFVTGATGALGPHLLMELLRETANEQVCALIRPGCHAVTRFESLRATVRQLAQDEGLQELALLDRLQPIVGDVRRDDLGLEDREREGLERHVDTVIHAAATTQFTAPVTDLCDVNVEGTRRVLDLARRCRRLQQFLFVSTACVAGTRTGTIAEGLEQTAGAFVNAYEHTKWEAEQLVATGAVPVRIARLSTCLGAARTGYVHRFGAIHQSIRWLARGLVPMVPAVHGSCIDLIATDLAAQWLARAVTRPIQSLDVCQVAAGRAAIPLAELVNAAVAHLRETTSGWSGGQIAAPVIVDTETFELFERSVTQSGDVLFGRVLEAARSFFPALRYPKVYDTARAEAVWGGPLPLGDWRRTLRQVIDFGIARDWRGPRRMRAQAHV